MRVSYAAREPAHQHGVRATRERIRGTSEEHARRKRVPRVFPRLVLSFSFLFFFYLFPRPDGFCTRFGPSSRLLLAAEQPRASMHRRTWTPPKRNKFQIRSLLLFALSPNPKALVAWTANRPSFARYVHATVCIPNVDRGSRIVPRFSYRHRVSTVSFARFIYIPNGSGYRRFDTGDESPRAGNLESSILRKFIRMPRPEKLSENIPTRSLMFAACVLKWIVGNSGMQFRLDRWTLKYRECFLLSW